jgi:hypothetical protein
VSALLISKADLQFFVVHLRERGVKPVSCNCWVRAMNAFKWLHEHGETSVLVKLPPQRLEKPIIDTHGEAALRAILNYRVIAANVETPPMHRLNNPITMSRALGRVRAYSSDPTTSRLSVNPWVVTPPLAALLRPWLRRS